MKLMNFWTFEIKIKTFSTLARRKACGKHSIYISFCNKNCSTERCSKSNSINQPPTVYFLCTKSLLTNPLPAFLPSLSDPTHLYEVHARPGHHDLFGWADPQPDADAQRRLRPAHWLGVHFCQPAAAHRDGRHGDRSPQRHLSHLRRWASRGRALGI